MNSVTDYIRGPAVPVQLLDGDTVLLETEGRAKAVMKDDGRLAVVIEVAAERKLSVTGWRTSAVRGALAMQFKEGRLVIPRKATLCLELLLMYDTPCPNGPACPLGLGA